MDEIMKLVEMGAGYTAIKAAAGDRSWVFVGVGQSRGKTDGFPKVVGSYHTMRDGILQNFHVSTAKVGDILQGETKRWKLIANQYTAGDAHMPAWYHFVAMEVQQ